MNPRYFCRPLFAAATSILFLTTGCKTYTVPVSGFQQQFAASGMTKSRMLRTQNPYGFVSQYATYPIRFIACVDKTGKAYKLPFGPSIEMRFTDTNGQRTVFFADLMTVDRLKVRGSQTHILNGVLGGRIIPVAAIRKIEVQDGKKRYWYVN